MIYKLTIQTPRAGQFALYAHPGWEHPLLVTGDPHTSYKVVFTVQENADSDNNMDVVVFKESHFPGSLIQLPIIVTDDSTLDMQFDLKEKNRTYVSKIERREFVS